jgi:hypothetical protein
MEHKTDPTEDYRYEMEFSNSLIELDTYRLLTIIFSSKNLHSSNLYGFPMAAWRFERAEIYRIVLMLSIKSRNQLDHKNHQIDSNEIEPLDRDIKSIGSKIIGTNEENGIVTDLTFREACNKIIHSEHINFGIIDPVNVTIHKGVTEFIYVYGTKNKHQWKATVNLILFSEITLRLLL